MGLTEPENPAATDPEGFVADEDPETTTDPLDPDTDDDRLLDCEEDLDGDGSVDEDETDPNDEDSDDGGVPDGDEVENGSDPFDPSDDVPGPVDTGDPLEPEMERWVGGSCQGCQSTGSGSAGLLGWLMLAGLAARRRRSAA